MPAATSESLDELQTRHRKEQRDLVSRITQKKKQASKKTRKGVNDECERLERELEERQARERAVQAGGVLDDDEDDEDEVGGAGGEEGHADRAKDADADAVEKREMGDAAENGAHGGPKRKKNRAKARLARRAAEHDALAAQAEDEAASMPDLREQERARMEQHFGKHGVALREMRADGHCLYAAVADQMATRGLGLTPRVAVKVQGDEKMPEYKKVRYAAADVIEGSPGDFEGFLEEPLGSYVHKIRETGEWGGHLELMALARSYGVKINVLHSDGRVDVIEAGDGKEEKEEDAREIWLGYYRHSHGLGEHYNSLRKVS